MAKGLCNPVSKALVANIGVLHESVAGGARTMRMAVCHFSPWSSGKAGPLTSNFKSGTLSPQLGAGGGVPRARCAGGSWIRATRKSEVIRSKIGPLTTHLHYGSHKEESASRHMGSVSGREGACVSQWRAVSVYARIWSRPLPQMKQKIRHQTGRQAWYSHMKQRS